MIAGISRVKKFQLLREFPTKTAVKGVSYSSWMKPLAGRNQIFILAITFSMKQ
jgi:hypothetical protein